MFLLPCVVRNNKNLSVCARVFIVCVCLCVCEAFGSSVSLFSLLCVCLYVFSFCLDSWRSFTGQVGVH